MDTQCAHQQTRNRPIARTTQAFAVFDRDGDGTISSSELGDVMRSLGLDPSEEDVSDILVRFDADGNGEIDKDEFVTMMNAILNCSADDDQEIVEAFKVFDIDGGRRGQRSPAHSSVRMREICTFRCGVWPTCLLYLGPTFV